MTAGIFGLLALAASLGPLGGQEEALAGYISSEKIVSLATAAGTLLDNEFFRNTFHSDLPPRLQALPSLGELSRP